VTAEKTDTVARKFVVPETWPLILGFVVLAVPTALKLAAQNWSEESGAQGPIILATGAWLLWRLRPEMHRLHSASNPWFTGLILIPALLAYVLGRVVDYVTFEAAGVFGVGVSMLYAQFGGRFLRRHWFPFLYLAFAIPPPVYIVLALTAPLKQFVSSVATAVVQLLDLPVSHQGVVIYVAQYQLLVEDACSGMNSIFGLLAIGLFYIYLVRGSSLIYSIILAVLMIPIAIMANIVRVIIVILLTYYFGDEVGQGFLHFAAGIFLFVIALFLVFALDAVLSWTFSRFRRQA
jgi:exosortase B